MTTKNKLSVSRKKIKKVKGWARKRVYPSGTDFDFTAMKVIKEDWEFAETCKVHKATLHITL